MANRGRPVGTVARKLAKVSLLPEHHQILETIDEDPFYEKRVYGARNHHFDVALTEYFEKYFPQYVKKTVDSEKSSMV